MGRIVAISSGSLESTRPINEFALGMVSDSSRRVLFIGTASRDNAGYIRDFSEAFAGLGCEVKALQLTVRAYTEQELTEILSWANVIYVGGGDTLYMMQVWRKNGLDRLLKAIYQKDAALLMGISAGAICWCSCGCTDSELAEIPAGASYGWANGMLDLLPFAYCPHYEDRVADFKFLMARKNSVGLAMESNTAVVEENGRLYCIRSSEDAKAYRLVHQNGVLEEEEIYAALV